VRVLMRKTMNFDEKQVSAEDHDMPTVCEMLLPGGITQIVHEAYGHMSIYLRRSPQPIVRTL